MYKLFIFIIILILIICKFNEYYFFAEPFYLENYNKFGFVKYYKNFISESDCSDLISYCKGQFKDSTLLSYFGSNYSDNKIRSSQNYYFYRGEHPIIDKIEYIISKELGVPVENIEPIQMVKYEKSQQYLYHYDFIFGTGNQRDKTFIIYLNTLNKSDGGATNFIKYNKKIYPIVGDAICFNNIDSFGRLNFMSQHQGDVIKTNTSKYILSIWIRKSKFIN